MTIAVPRGEHGKSNVLNHFPEMVSGFHGISDGVVCVGDVGDMMCCSKMIVRPRLNGHLNIPNQRKAATAGTPWKPQNRFIMKTHANF